MAYIIPSLWQITIIFKNSLQCIEPQIYLAELDNVPAAFADGSVTSGERRGQHSLSVRSQNPGRHAEIRAVHIGTILVVRQSGHSLGLSVRLPRAIAEAFSPEQDLQLCVWGCPTSQRLERPPRPPSSSFPSYSLNSSSPQPYAAAQAHCAALLPARDVYYQACLFDLLATGDINSSTAAVAALEDARDMITNPDKVHLRLAATADRSVQCLPVVLAVAILAERLAALWSGQCARTLWLVGAGCIGLATHAYYGWCFLTQVYEWSCPYTTGYATTIFDCLESCGLVFGWITVNSHIDANYKGLLS